MHLKDNDPLCECGARWYEVDGVCGNLYCDSDHGAVRRQRMTRHDLEDMLRWMELNNHKYEVK